MILVRLKDLIAPAFYELHKDIKKNKHTHYWLKGGRGSTKSSFVSIEIILGIMRDEQANAVVLRKVKDTLKGSVFEQIKWGIEKLGVSNYWTITTSPMQATYLPTGQKIIFRGADDPRKIKGVKVSKGYIKYVWYEEVDEFRGVEEIRTINQSSMRGGKKFAIFYTYNPPKRANNWVNKEVLINRDDRLIHHSTYLDVPREWLGEQFLLEAEHLKQNNELAYRHEYLGEVVGGGGEIFNNIKIREITDKEIKTFDRIRQGIDWGYTIDPFVYIVVHYDSKKRKLYIIDEIYKVGISNRLAAEKIKKKKYYEYGIIMADGSEPKSIDELKTYGLRIKGAKRGPGSIEFGIKWLSDLNEIVIDINRTPNAAKEFVEYALEEDGNGGFKAKYPDKNNHTIDAIRYALEDEMKARKATIGIKPFGF